LADSLPRGGFRAYEDPADGVGFRTCRQHIDSGEAAVPTIDTLAGVHNLNEADDDVIGLLIASGWEHRPDINVMIPSRRFLS